MNSYTRDVDAARSRILELTRDLRAIRAELASLDARSSDR